jgi:cyclopropane fatty-acyl-phospholipid synthase-like methyltransferase
MITLKTEYPIAIDSRDHLNPYGCVQDSNTNAEYIKEVKNYFNNKQLKVLDIGCAGGQLMVDHHLSGDIAVGIEGSSHALHGKGKNNWSTHKDAVLFLCDASRPFTIHKDGEQIYFDYVQSWEVIEHIPPERLNVFFTNIKNLLHKDSLFCGSIATTPCSSGNHVSLFPLDGWVSKFKENGLKMEPYIFKHTLRSDLNSCIIFTSKLVDTP